MADTKDVLMRHLLGGPSRVSELADIAGVSKTAVRRHMEGLVDEGAVEAFFRQEGIGRPSKFYQLTDEGRERFPRRYDLAAEQLIRGVIEEDGEEGLGQAMEAAGRQLAETLQDKVPNDGSRKGRAQALVDVLEELGFPTELEIHDDRFVIVRRDCIFLKLANEHRDAVCGHLDTTLLETLTGDDVELEGCLPDGQGSCRHTIPRPRGAE